MNDTDFVVVPDYYLGDQLVYVPDIKLLYCDIDGTLANLDHRLKFIATRPKNWAAFEAYIMDDKPIPWVVNLVNFLWESGTEVVLMTARGMQNYEPTIAWLDSAGVSYDSIYFRKEGDYREDSIVKKELYNQVWLDYGERDPDLILDDRTRVVQMWRGMGLNCIQVNYGDF